MYVNAIVNANQKKLHLRVDLKVQTKTLQQIVPVIMFSPS